MADRPLKRSYSTMAGPSDGLPGDSDSFDDTRAHDGSLQGALASTDSMEDTSPGGGSQQGAENSHLAPDEDCAESLSEEDTGNSEKATKYITGDILTHRTTSTPSRLLELPAELLSEIVVRLDKGSMSALRLVNKELTESISREFGLLLHSLRVEFAPEGFDKLLKISQSRYAENVKSIEFWARDFHLEEFARLGREFTADSFAAFFAGVEVDDDDETAYKKYCKRRFQALRRVKQHGELAQLSTQLQDSLRASLSALPSASSFSMKVRYCTINGAFEEAQDELESCAPFSSWHFQALIGALAGRGLVTNCLTLHDTRFPADDDAHPGLPRALDSLQILSSVSELDLVFWDYPTSLSKYNRVAEIISQTPNIRILRLEMVVSGCHFLPPSVMSLLARHMNLPRLQLLGLKNLTICYSSLRRILAGHPSLDELSITFCEFHGASTLLEVYMMIDQFLDWRCKASLSHNTIAAP